MDDSNINTAEFDTLCIGTDILANPHSNCNNESTVPDSALDTHLFTNVSCNVISDENFENGTGDYSMLIKSTDDVENTTLYKQEVENCEFINEYRDSQKQSRF